MLSSRTGLRIDRRHRLRLLHFYNRSIPLPQFPLKMRRCSTTVSSGKYDGSCPAQGATMLSMASPPRAPASRPNSFYSTQKGTPNRENQGGDIYTSLPPRRARKRYKKSSTTDTSIPALGALPLFYVLALACFGGGVKKIYSRIR